LPQIPNIIPTEEKLKELEIEAMKAQANEANQVEAGSTKQTD
jgi:hypothetical protein